MGSYAENPMRLIIFSFRKFQNIIRAPKKAKIGKIAVDIGASLVSDQTIVEFAKE